MTNKLVQFNENLMKKKLFLELTRYDDRHFRFDFLSTGLHGHHTLEETIVRFFDSRDFSTALSRVLSSPKILDSIFRILVR